MQLSLFTDYSLRVLIYLQQHPERSSTISEIAAYHGISRDHLVKVVHHLGKHGFVKTSRGKGGGVFLARPAEHINLRDVISRTEKSFNLVECSHSKSECPLVKNCLLEKIFNRAVETFLESLALYNLDDLLDSRVVNQRDSAHITPQPIISDAELAPLGKHSVSPSLEA